MPDWYWNFWCDAQLRLYDPYGCGIGLAFGAVAIPGLALGTLAAVVWLLTHDWNKRR